MIKNEKVQLVKIYVRRIQNEFEIVEEKVIDTFSEDWFLNKFQFLEMGSNERGNCFTCQIPLIVKLVRIRLAMEISPKIGDSHFDVQFPNEGREEICVFFDDMPIALFRYIRN